MTVPRKTPPECPIEQFIAVLSGRWKAMILWRLFIDPQRYSVLQSLIPSVTQRALSQALSEVADDGVIVRADEHWSLTPLGAAMSPALAAMFAWGSLDQVARDQANNPLSLRIISVGNGCQD